MTPTELEAYDAMIADRDRWKERAKRLEILSPSGITLLDAKWLDPACHAGCQSLVIPRKLLESFREHMVAAVQIGEICEGYAQYAGDVLQAICRPNAIGEPAADSRKQ